MVAPQHPMAQQQQQGGLSAQHPLAQQPPPQQQQQQVYPNTSFQQQVPQQMTPQQLPLSQQMTPQQLPLSQQITPQQMPLQLSQGQQPQPPPPPPPPAQPMTPQQGPQQTPQAAAYPQIVAGGAADGVNMLLKYSPAPKDVSPEAHIQNKQLLILHDRLPVLRAAAAQGYTMTVTSDGYEFTIKGRHGMTFILDKLMEKEALGKALAEAEATSADVRDGGLFGLYSDETLFWSTVHSWHNAATTHSAKWDEAFKRGIADGMWPMTLLCTRDTHTHTQTSTARSACTAKSAAADTDTLMASRRASKGGGVNFPLPELPHHQGRVPHLLSLPPPPAPTPHRSTTLLLALSAANPAKE